MFDLKKEPEIINHLQKISFIYTDRGSEVVILCPFCDDANRKSTRIDHGHCYISTSSPVFNCFRCGASGGLVKLLVFTDFPYLDILKELSHYTSFQFNKDYYKTIINTQQSYTNLESCKKLVKNELINFQKQNRDAYKTFIDYIFRRFGEISILKFLFYPQFLSFNNINYLCCSFNNSEKELVTSRVLNNPKIRYKNSSSNNWYFFQPFDFGRFSRVVITEGPTDLINIYCYNNIFNPSNTFYMAICGKKYISAIERLLIQELLIGKFEINIIFDQDVTNYKSFIYKANKLLQLYNNKINIRGWLPLIKEYKDVGEFPAIMEVT